MEHNVNVTENKEPRRYCVIKVRFANNKSFTIFIDESFYIVDEEWPVTPSYKGHLRKFRVGSLNR